MSRLYLNGEFVRREAVPEIVTSIDILVDTTTSREDPDNLWDGCVRFDRTGYDTFELTDDRFVTRNGHVYRKTNE